MPNNNGPWPVGNFGLPSGDRDAAPRTTALSASSLLSYRQQGLLPESKRLEAGPSAAGQRRQRGCPRTTEVL